ncbi:hypothetical protein YC2023_096100 [Brassica napus]
MKLFIIEHHLVNRTSTRNLTDSYKTLNNGLVADYKGNAYVTNSGKTSSGKWIMTLRCWLKLTQLSRFRFERNCVQQRRISLAGLGGESNTWKMFKVNEETGTASIVLMNGDLAAADVMLRRRGEIRLWWCPRRSFVQRMCFPILLHLESNVTEAILSRTFFKDFEASGFQENVSTRIVNLKRRNKAFLCRE